MQIILKSQLISSVHPALPSSTLEASLQPLFPRTGSPPPLGHPTSHKYHSHCRPHPRSGTGEHEDHTGPLPSRAPDSLHCPPADRITHHFGLFVFLLSFVTHTHTIKHAAPRGSTTSVRCHLSGVLPAGGPHPSAVECASGAAFPPQFAYLVIGMNVDSYYKIIKNERHEG